MGGRSPQGTRDDRADHLPLTNKGEESLNPAAIIVAIAYPVLPISEGGVLGVCRALPDLNRLSR